ncbi:MAG: GNAT family N-acetyltransferase [Planctomycetes bacterium]|nr:GNAT family N-acetyltransferase [Planctomycetota bacterium]
MKKSERIKVGLVGAAGRGGNFRSALELNNAVIHAICDINEEALERAAQQFGVEETYTSYDDMLDRSELDAVVIGTPMQFHVPQSIKALERGIHVLSEVPAGVSIQECKDLVRACETSDAVYMMAENYTYMRPNVFVKALAEAGLFGELYYAEGEYLHELKQLNEDTPWRRKWQTGIDGVTYPTHSLGPILQWMAPDRVARVCCEGSGQRHRDPRGDLYHQDSAVMLCKTEKDALIKVRLDMISDRPHAMTNYQLQGTDGVYESARGGPGEDGKLWLRALSDEVKWHALEQVISANSLGGRYLPERWLNPPEAARKAGHGGGDYYEVEDFLRAIRGEAPCPIGIHEAMDMTLPGLVSQESIRRYGIWLEVPDSRQWAYREVSLKDGRTVTVRPLRLDDAAALGDFYESVPEEDNRFYCPYPLNREQAAKNAARANETDYVCVVLENPEGEIVGYAWYDWEAHKPDKSIFGICVRHDYQNNGSGQTLMKRVLQIARHVGPPVMTLTVQKANPAGFNLYQKMGFKVVREYMRGPIGDGKFPPEPECYMEQKTRG